jgi:hypothetical protein
MGEGELVLVGFDFGEELRGGELHKIVGDALRVEAVEEQLGWAAAIERRGHGDVYWYFKKSYRREKRRMSISKLIRNLGDSIVTHHPCRR